ncbi:ABC transporter permease [Edaphobacter albus]|uniref:ABC transporter permease n=1 Tax=Edaphobacter sp. 4G125 TaxID=2763071 RepID=UPI001645A011|nr:ABC transporter permease [Edaphobacter sp. 4G125]QNI35776.1 ABC transporter permease [Edaphobacter sp. 4G125]
MRRIRVWLLKILGIVPKQTHEQDFSSELESHLQLHIDDNLRSGMSPEEARRNAILRLGGVEHTKQAHREGRTIPFLETLLQDIRYALRQLRRNPGFTITAIIMLALGIGASVAIFSFVDAALIQPLPYANPTRLVDVAEHGASFSRSNLSYLDYVDWKRSNKVFSSLDAYTGSGYLLKTPSGTEPVPAARVSDGFFRTLGVHPILGRDFYSGEDQPNAPATVILTYGAWQQRFGGRKDVINQIVTLDGTPTIIIGVLPENFQFAPRGRAELWTTLHQLSNCEKRRTCHNLFGIARLKDGVSFETAQTEMAAIAKQLEIQYPGSNRDQGAHIGPLSELIVGEIRPILLVLLTGACLLLLIACVNVSSLLLVRSESRRREFAVRSALGASPARLVRQFITEGLILVTAGTLSGLAVGAIAMRFMLSLISKDMLSSMPYLNHLAMSPRVLGFTMVISFLAATVFSLTPVLRLPTASMREALNEGDRGSVGALWRRMGANLVVLELTVAVVLLVAAGLLGKSFYRLLHVDLAFDPSNLATVIVELPEQTYNKNETIKAITHKITDRVAALPSVTSVGTTSELPATYNGNTNWIRIVGHPFHGEHNEVNSRQVSSGFFNTIRASLIRGRLITDQDDSTRSRVSVINKAFADKYFSGEDPIGKKYGDGDLKPDSMREIVGIVDNIRESSLEEDIWPAEYTPASQEADSELILIVRTSGDDKSLLPTLSAAIHQIDPGIGTTNEQTMLQHINNSQTAYLHRSAAWIVGGFAALALLLGVIGLYGVIAYSVSQRTREIGVRMALGAARGSVYQLILKEAGRLTILGIAAGIFCSIASAAFLRKLLFGVRSWDLATLATVVLLLSLATLLASFIPARRAASINPVEALRAE